MDDIFYDLYLYVAPESDKLNKIPHLTRECAEMYAKHWFEMNELHEFMLVTEGSTPWSEPIPTIVEKTPEWIFLEYQKLSKV